LVPADSRLKESVAEHLKVHNETYLGNSTGLCDLHVRPITHSYDRVVDYVFKTMLRGRISYDDGTLILPRATREIALS
jgi:hypothetical protein